MALITCKINFTEKERKKLKIDKRLHWAKTYVKNAIKAFPKLRKIKKIRAVECGPNLDVDGPARAYYDSDKMEIVISLYVDKKQPGEKYNHVELIETIAHEFTHAYQSEHVPFMNFIYIESGIMGAMVGRSIEKKMLKWKRRR